MRLGVDTGNLTSFVMGNSTRVQPEPAVGMGVTFLYWTDRDAATVTEILTIDGRPVLRCQKDKAVRIDGNGMSDSQSYAYAPDPEGETLFFRKARNGRWYEIKFNGETKRWRKTSDGPGLKLGERCSYHDYSF